MRKRIYNIKTNDMNAAIKNNLKLKMNLAHCIAKQLSGNYSARMSFALRLINKSKANNYGFDSKLHAYGVNKYWSNMSEFNTLSNEVVAFVEQEMIIEPKKAANWWSNLSDNDKKSMMVKGLFGRKYNSLNETEIKYLYRCAN